MRSGAATATADELPLHLTSRAARVIDINWILTYYRTSIGDRGRVPGPSASEAQGRARSPEPEEAVRLLAPSAFLVRWVFEAWAGPYGGSSLVSLA